MNEFIQFATNHPYLVGAAIMLAVLIVFNEVKLASRGYTEITPGDAVKLINVDATVLDVRTAESYAGGHIYGARNTPADSIDPAAKDMAKLKDKPVLTYCDTGAAGSRAAAVLRKAEFSKVFNLQGGLEAWKRENYPVSEPNS